MNTNKISSKLLTKSFKGLCLMAFIILTSVQLKAQTTYYWIHNTGSTNANLSDQITVGGTIYWRHLTTTPGSTVGLVPVTISFAGMGNDDFVIDNSSFSFAVATPYTINFNSNITLKNIITTSFTGGVGGFTTINILYFGTSGTTTTVKQNMSMTTSTKLAKIGINNVLEIDPNAGATCNLLFGQRPVQIDTKFLLRGSGGTFNFNDPIITNGGGNITVQANTAADATNTSVNFNQSIKLNNTNGMVVNNGRVNFYNTVACNTATTTLADGTKTAQKTGITIGNTAAGINGFTHVVLNANDTTDNALAPINNFNRIGFAFVTGYINFKNVKADSSQLFSQTKTSVYPGGPTTSVDTFLTNQKTKMVWMNTGTGAGVLDWRTAAYLSGTYIFDAMKGGTAAQYQVVCDRINMVTFKDTVKVKCNALLGFVNGSNYGVLYNGYNCTIDKDAVMKLDSGNVYDFNNLNYATDGLRTLHVKGKLYIGGVYACGVGGKPTILKNARINFNFPAGNPRFIDIKSTQLINTQAQPEAPLTFKSIDVSNTDMGGNTNWGIGGIGFGTAPYNVIPYTGSAARNLRWNNVLSGGTFWSEIKWYNELDGDGVYNDCPPTYIDSVMVTGGSDLQIDVRFAQCKTLWFQGATSTLRSRNLVSDSLNTLEIFGSLIIDNILNNRFYRNINFRAWQTYPIIKTSGTFFHRGIAFRSLNSSNSINPELTIGTWLLQDDFTAYSSAETFTAVPAPAAPGTKYIINRKFFPNLDANSFWPTNSTNYIPEFNFQVLAGNFITNGYNINTYNFYLYPEKGIIAQRSLNMAWVATPTVGINRKTIINIYNAQSIPYPAIGWKADADAGRTKIYPDSSHIRQHTPGSDMRFNVNGTSRLYYWDATFMYSKAVTGTPAGYDARFYGGRIHARNITVYGSDFSSSTLNTGLTNDTIRKLTFLDSRPGSKVAFAASTGATIDSLIINTPQSSFYGNNNIRKYLYFAPGSNNALNTSTLALYTTGPMKNVRDSLTHSWKVKAPYGAKMQFNNNCYTPGIISGGTIINAGDAVPFSSVHYYNLPAPRDTFDIQYANINTNTLTVAQTVDGTNNLNGAVNWIAGSTSPRILVFRGNTAADGGNWADNNVWALGTYLPSGQNVTYTVGLVGACAPNCSDTVIFDNQSFISPSDSCYFTSGSSNYVGLLRWKVGAMGILGANRTTQLTVCYAWDCQDGSMATGLTNRFRGRTIFTSPRVDAYIRSSSSLFSGPIEWSSSDQVNGKLSLKDSISFVIKQFDPSGLSWPHMNIGFYSESGNGLIIDKGNFDSYGFNINAALIQSTSSFTRSINLRNSKVTIGSNGAALVGGYVLGGDLSKLIHNATAANIYINGGASANSSFGLQTWRGAINGVAYLGGFKFKSVIIDGNGGYGQNISIRNDTISDILKINGSVTFSETYKKSFINKLLWTATNYANIGNTNSFASKNAFVGLRINEFNFTGTPGFTYNFRWDSIFVKDKYIINSPGSTINHTSGGVTHFANKCKILIEGSSSGTLRIDASPNVKVYPIYNIPGTVSYTTAEHYYRKDSGTVCTEYTNIYNLWAIGNGNTIIAPTHGTWAAPNPSPTPHYSLMDTTQASSYFYSTPIPIASNYNRFTNASNYLSNVTRSGRARFYVGQNATLISNAKGWDDNKFPPVPSLTIATVGYTICQTQSVTLNFTGVSGIPFDLVYYNNSTAIGDTIKITSESQLDGYNGTNNTFTISTVVTPTSSTNYYLGYVVTDRCTNIISAIGTGTTTIIVNPNPSLILATSSPTTICNAVPFNLNANATAGQTYTLFPTPTGTANPTAMTSYTVGAAVNGSVTIAAGTYTAGSTPATYTVYVAATSSLGCASLTRTPVQITINPTPSVAVASNSILCFGQATGVVSYTATGGSGSGYGISPSTNSLLAGTYNYTVTDGVGCKTNTTVTIAQPASALTAATSNTANTNCATNDGQALVTPIGGTSTYSYTWQGGQTTSSITAQTGGTYSVIVTDANACTYTTQATIANPAAPVISASSNTNVICSGNNITITPSGGATTYSIIPSIGTATTGVAGATIITPTATTSYSVVGTNSTSCLSNTINLNVTVNATPIVTIAATSSIICNGQSTTLNLTGASTYTLVNTGSAITSGTSFNPSTNTTYTVQGSTGGCTSINTQQLITVNSLPTVTALSSNTAICSGSTATLTAGGASSYTWTSGPIAATYTTGTAGIYTVTGTSVNNCVNTQTVSLNVNALPIVTAVSSNTAICSGATATLTAGGASTYSWMSGPSTSTYAVNSAGIYTVTGTDGNNCVNTKTISLTVNATPTVAIAASNNTICIGANTALTLTGASSYTLINTGSAITSGASVSPTTTTTYSIQGSTGTCTSLATQQLITVNVLPTVTAVSSNTVICSGNTATLTAGGATTYTWSGGPAAANYTIATAGTYTVTGTNANNCVNTQTISLAVNALPIVTAISTNTAICSGNTATLTAGGASTYTWTSGPTTASYTIATAGVYTVTGTDGNTCVNTQTVSLIVKTLPTVTAGTLTNVSCFGLNNGSVNFVTGSGTPNYTVTGTNVSGTTASSLAPNNYTYTVTDAAGCISTTTLAITQPTAALLSSAAQTATNTSCTTADGVATITITGGTSNYTITPSSGLVSSNTITGLGTGIHSYTVTDFNNCKAINSVTITGATGITSSIAAQSDVLCNGNSTASVTVQGGNEASGTYNYTLTNTTTSLTITNNTSGAFTNLPAGTYSVLITGAVSNCYSSQNITITQPTLALALTGITANSVICYGGSAQVTSTITGGTQPYTYTWSAANTSTISTATYTAGNYNVNISDANGCTLATQNFTVAGAPVLAISSVPTTTTGCGLSNGTATLNVTGGWNSSYTYSLNGVSQATNTIGSLTAATYTADVTDALGCTTQTVFTIANPNTPTLSIASATTAICLGQTATITPLGATSYTLNGVTTFTNSTVVNPTSSTVYQITGTDAANCISAPLSVTVTVNALPTLTVVATNTVICANQTATLTASGANTYNWSAGPATASYTTATAGTYTVTGTDGNNCVNTQTVSISVNALPTVTAGTLTNVSCFGLNNGSVNFVTGSGTPNYTVTGTNVSGTTASNLSPNNYTYTVTDAAGCVNTTTLSITQPTAALLSSAVQTATNTSCTAANGVVTVTITGGTMNYTITPSSGIIVANTITGLNTGVHSYTITDANGCNAVNSVTITGATGITSSITAQSNVLCNGNSTASVTVLGLDETSGTYNFSLTPITATTTSSSNTTGVFTGLSAGTYSVLITGAVSNCVSSQNITITQPTSALVLTGITANSVTCNGGSAQVTTTITGGTQPYTYTWSATNTSTTSSATYTAGAYSVNISDANGCTLATQNFTVAGAPVLAISSVPTTTTGCGLSNGTATLNVTGGWNSSYTYSLNGVSQATNTIGSLTAATYTADVTDALGCTTQTVFTIANPNTPTLSIASVTTAICAGQSTTITPTGATSYTLNGATTFTNSTVVNPTSTTVYQITGTDAINCISAPLTVTVTVNALPTLTVGATSTVVCANQTATLTASGANTYVWTAGPSTADYAVTAAGTYTVVGTNTVTGCQSNEATITLIVNAIPSAAIASQTNVLCFGTNSGGVSITTNATTSAINPATSGLGAGAYTFTITDLASMCTNTIAVSISEPTSSLSASSNTTTNTSCTTPNGSFTITAVGGTPTYSYNVINTTGVFINQTTGTQNISINDANGCTYTLAVIVPGVATPSIASSTQTNVLCNGQNTGSAIINIAGGTLPYVYNWTNSSSTASVITNVGANSYAVIVTDNGGCIISNTFVITEPTAINVITTDVNSPCVGQSNGAISVEITGGTPNYNTTWTPTGSINNTGGASTISNITEGQYIATVTDANNCVFQYPVQLAAQNGVGCILQIPEIFSPNGDGKNDTWDIIGLENYPNNTVTVFNRWGDQVFTAEPYKSDWDGTNTGDKSILGKGTLPVGTYYFILDLGNGDKPITGYVQITK